MADLNTDLPPEWEKLLAHAALEGLPVYHWKQVAESLSGMVDIEHLSENNLGSLLPSSVYRRFKHVIDVVAAIAVLPIALPIIGIAALAIRLTDGGPVIFSQQRMGFRARQFKVLKLRTMRLAVVDGSAFTEANDSRILRVGHFLRRYRIDELPQIFNILRGEMSWIGPRPEFFSSLNGTKTKYRFTVTATLYGQGLLAGHRLIKATSQWSRPRPGSFATISTTSNISHRGWTFLSWREPSAPC